MDALGVIHPILGVRSLYLRGLGHKSLFATRYKSTTTEVRVRDFVDYFGLENYRIAKSWDSPSFRFETIVIIALPLFHSFRWLQPFNSLSCKLLDPRFQHSLMLFKVINRSNPQSCHSRKAGRGR